MKRRTSKAGIDGLCRGCVAIIAEKPRSAYKIALYLSGGKPEKISVDGIPVWRFVYGGKTYVVVPSAGHLFSISTRRRGFPVFEYMWLPRHLVEKGKGYLRKYYDVFSRILPRASMYINACDYDIEGSVIGYMIIKKWGDVARMRRMKFSALTRSDILRSFRNLAPADYDMINAGLARHELDWLWGINVSRALTQVMRSLFGELVRKALSAGRVQTPTLFEVVNSYIARESFVPRVFFGVDIYVRYGGSEYRLESVDGVFDLRDSAVRHLQSVRSDPVAVVVDYVSRHVHIDPPNPPNLSDVQHDIYRLYGVSPSHTLKILEDLYLDSLISYPRTNSQKYPPSIDYISILKAFRSAGVFSSYIDKILGKGDLRPNNGRGEDPAHPAIYPTGELPRGFRSKLHKAIYEYIVRRFISTFMDPAIVSRSVALFDVKGRRYRLSGSVVVEGSWLNVFSYYRVDERSIPVFVKGSRVPISRTGIRRVYEKPPALYNKSSLLKWMEKMNIGTESTRAEIIDILFKRKYVEGSKRITPTRLGLLVYHVVSRRFSEISRVELTREFEYILDSIRKGLRSKDEVIKRAVDTLRSVLSRANDALETNDHDMGSSCPICGLPVADRDLGLCCCHSAAYRRVYEVFRHWERSGYSWGEYLDFLAKSRYVGRFVKDLIAAGYVK